jgi:hypothetical protein
MRPQHLGRMYAAAADGRPVDRRTVVQALGVMMLQPAFDARAEEPDRPVGSFGTPPRPTLRVRDFVDGIGMNTKFKDVASQYGRTDIPLKRLQYLGVRLVREGFPARELTDRQMAGYRALAAAGGRFTFVTHNEKPIAQMVADIAAFEREFPGAVRAVEGPNELNNWPITYQGITGQTAAKSYMSGLYAAVRNDPTLSAANVLVYGATDYPAIATTADLANIHSYERNALGSHERLRTDRDEQLGAYAADPVSPPGLAPGWVVTETGYHTWVGSGYAEGVDPDTQAKLGMMLLLNVAELGGREVYWYQLLDAWGVPGNGEAAFGIFDHSGAPKPFAIALHNLTALLEDSGENAKTFAATPRPYSISGNRGSQPHNGVYHLLMQRSDGVHMLALWREGVIWDVNADCAIALAPQTTTVSLATPAARIEVHDLLSGQEPIETLERTAWVDLSLTDHPLMLKIS